MQVVGYDGPAETQMEEGGGHLSGADNGPAFWGSGSSREREIHSRVVMGRQLPGWTR